MLERLAELAERRGRRVVIVAVVLAIAAGALGAGVADRLDPYGADDPATESVKGADRLEQAGYRETGVVVLVDDVDLDSAAGRDRIEALTEELRADEDVAAVASFYTTGSRDFISRDGSSTYLAVQLAPTDDREIQDAGERISSALEHESASWSAGRGRPAAGERTGRAGPAHGRALCLPDLVRALAAVLPQPRGRRAPTAGRGLTIVGAMLMLTVASELESISVFALNLVIGLGLGLAIDYSLFIVSRYREEIAKTGPGLEAMRRTMATAGRTVLFSALTVAGALASLLVFPQRSTRWASADRWSR